MQTTVVEASLEKSFGVKKGVKRFFKYDEEGVYYITGTTMKFSAGQLGNMQ